MLETNVGYLWVTRALAYEVGETCALQDENEGQEMLRTVGKKRVRVFKKKKDP